MLRVLSEVSGLDFVLQPGVSGRVSLRLTETPWDQALDVILRSHGLGHLLDGGVLRVGALADLAAEQMDRQRHEEQRELSGELVTLRRTLAFVEPEQVRELLESRLSERGTLIADPRTGTVLMTDIGARVREIESVLDALDIPGAGRGDRGPDRPRHPDPAPESRNPVGRRAGARSHRQEVARVHPHRRGRDRRVRRLVQAPPAGAAASGPRPTGRAGGPATGWTSRSAAPRRARSESPWAPSAAPRTSTSPSAPPSGRAR